MGVESILSTYYLAVLFKLSLLFRSDVKLFFFSLLKPSFKVVFAIAIGIVVMVVVKLSRDEHES